MYSIIYNNGEKLIFLTFIIYPLLVIFLGTFLDEMKLNANHKVSRKIIINKDSYIINRINLLFGKTSFHMFIYLIVFYLLLAIIISIGSENIPMEIVYVYLLMLPVCLVFFIYIGVRSGNERNLRKIISYTVLLLLVVFDSYNKFKGLIYGENQDTVFKSYIIYIILAVFSAIENIVQAIYDDYHLFMAKKGKKTQV